MMSDEPEPWLVPLDQFEEKPQHWVWDGVIPEGTLTVFKGEPKGMNLLSLFVAAQVTRGLRPPTMPVAAVSYPIRKKTPATKFAGVKSPGIRPEPEPVKPGLPRSVVFVSREDALDETLLPQFSAMGADVSKLFLFRPRGTSKPGGQVTMTPAMASSDVEIPPIRLARDLSRFEASLRKLQEAGKDIGLIVINPIDRYFNLSDKRSVRIGVYGQLAELAMRSEIAILAISDPKLSRNGVGDDLIGLASQPELVSIARSVYVVTGELGHPNQWEIGSVKTNLCEPRTGLAFSVRNATLEWSS